jgi:hypothetical protein
MTKVVDDIAVGSRRLAITVDWDRSRGLIGVEWQPDQLSGPGSGIVFGLGYFTIGVNVYEALAPDDLECLDQWRNECQVVSDL